MIAEAGESIDVLAMLNSNARLLATLVRARREDILSRWRQQVRKLPAAQDLDVPTINDHVPKLLDQLAEALLQHEEEAAAETISISKEHGLLRWQEGFNVGEVVAEYNILRGCLLEITEEQGIAVSAGMFHVLNKVFDEAIGRAITAFETMMIVELRRRHKEQIAFVLHDLRTPLSAMALAASVLGRSLTDGERHPAVEHALAVLRNNIQRMSQQVRHVLTTARALDKPFDAQFTQLNLRTQVDSIIRDLEPVAIAADTEIKNEISDEIEVYSDELLLAQIMQNLLSNAIKFTPQGLIEIGAREIDEGRSIECWVRDTGQGIPPDQIDKIFEKFETGDEEKGTGLGLTIVREIVELHEGKISVESQLGKGSTFTFVLPRRKSD